MQVLERSLFGMIVFFTQFYIVYLWTHLCFCGKCVTFYFAIGDSLNFSIFTSWPKRLANLYLIPFLINCQILHVVASLTVQRKYI